MAPKIPTNGDVRVCFIPSVPDHAIIIDVPDVTAGRLVHDAITAILTSENEHHRYQDVAAITIQQFEDGWDDVDPIDPEEPQIEASS